MARDPYHRVGTDADFVEGRGVAVRIGDQRVAVFRVAGKLHAMQDDCPHMGASLADGKILEGRRVTCHMHGWTFDLDTGKPQGGRANCARIYEIETRDDGVWVRIPEPAVRRRGDDEPWVSWTDDFIKKKPGGGSS